MGSNTEEEIHEITSDKEQENQRHTAVLVRVTENDRICTEENSTSVGTERELHGKEKDTTQNGLKENLCGWVSETARRFGFIRGYDERVPQVRVYQVWPGKNVFFLRGQMICSRDSRGFILTMISVIVCEWIFFSYSSDRSLRLPAIVSILSVILSIIVLINLFLAGTRDPGIIPRNEEAPLAEIGMSTQNKSISRCRSRRFNVNGIEVKVKYCRICEIYRPPRNTHCAVCDNCVDKFDHHCPWIGQCIELRNYRRYLMFVFSAFVFFLFIFVVSSWRIAMKVALTNKNTLRIIWQMPETFTLAIFSLIFVSFLGGLLAFHVYLISLNQTAHERFKQRYVNSANPYDKGVIENIKEILFAKHGPSRLDFRAVVEPDWNSVSKELIMSSGKDRSKKAQSEMQQGSCSDQNIDPEIEEIEHRMSNWLGCSVVNQILY